MKRVVIGSFFGDEGKGHTTNYLADNADAVVRFSGGQQAGHMVYHNNERHIFSNFGSGTLKGVPTYWDKACTVDPVCMMNEYYCLKSIGVTPKLFLHSEAPITTPFDKMANIAKDEKDKHGTVGLGVGKTLEREKNFYSLKVIDMLYFHSIFLNKYHIIKNDYYRSSIKTKYYSTACSKETNFINSVKQLIKLIESNVIEVYSDLPNFENIIYEGSQGMLLDPNIGYFPNVTYSDLKPPKGMDEYYFVLRSYLTRHGNGFMPKEDLGSSFPIKRNPTETNRDDGIQGVFRRTILDVSLLKYVIDRLSYVRKGKLNLVITCLDHLEKYFFFDGNGFHSYKTKEDFADAIGMIVGADDVFISDGDTEKDIRKI